MTAHIFQIAGVETEPESYLQVSANAVISGSNTRYLGLA
jgi:hypothetical protein